MADAPRYYRVSPAFWSDPKVIAWDDDTRLLALYILTCEHRTTEGLFRLPKQYILADLEWSAEQLAEPFRRLLEDGFIEYDEAAKVMLIVKALAYQAPANPNGVKHAVAAVAKVPKTPLYARFYALAEQYSERLHEGLPEPLGEPPAPAPAPAPAPERLPVGNGEPFVKKLAKELHDQHGWQKPQGASLHDSFQALLAAALEHLPEERHHPTKLGVIAGYLETTGVTLTKEARSHTARLVSKHAARDVLKAWDQAVEWGAGLSDGYANDPLSLSKYAAAVLGGKGKP